VGALLPWYRRQARDLPWRRTRDPYAIWIAEIMLQQTQVQTVIPYYERWMRVFPDVRCLAAAAPESVLKAWEGLGYYSRARNLQRAARVIAAEYRGRFPREYDAVLELPGIGRYTAGAICSIAFHQPTPVLDGNVLRVLTRVYGIRDDPQAQAANARLWVLAENLVQASARFRHGGQPSCGRLNQALMELGALVCTPKNPGCAECPWRVHCQAKRAGWVDQLPNLRPRPKAVGRRFVAFVGQVRRRFWIRQRPDGGINAGLWEFPQVEIKDEHADVMELADRLFEIKPVSVTRLGLIRHSITRYRMTLEVYRVELPVAFRPAPTVGADGGPSLGRWSSWGELEPLAFTAAHRKIIRWGQACLSSNSSAHRPKGG
jgi:A/G-specific adenine glycosylase